MYRVFLIDDEPWAMVSLEHLIDWHSLGFEVVCKIDNARTAWSHIQEEKPDVIITDIRMPGLSGLELLSLIHESDLPTKVVLVSAFADFAYAQEAIRKGASEYLLKPVRRDKFTACIQALGKALDESRQQQFRSSFDINRELLPQCQTLQELYCAISGQPFPDALHLLHCGAALDRQLCQHTDRLQWIRIEIGADNIFYLCAGTKQADSLFDICTQLCPPDQPGCFGMIGPVQPDETLPVPLWQAQMVRHSAAFAGCGGLRNSAARSDFPQEYELFKALQYDQHDMIYTHLEALRGQVMTGQILLDKLFVLLQSMDTLLKHTLGKASVLPAHWKQYADLIKDYPSCEAFFTYLTTSLTEDPEEALLAPILLEIERHYAHIRNLADFCPDLGVSQAYLSQLIRRRTGKTYSELVQEKRMDKAKELLAYSDQAVMDIAIQIGYSDQFYFSKLFKRIFGVSPGIWRKKVRSGNEITKLNTK